MANQENMLKWIEALESGEYPQDPKGGHLKTERGYCCLGVGEELRGCTWTLVDGGAYETDEGRRSYPSEKFVRDFLELTPEENRDPLDVFLGGRFRKGGEFASSWNDNGASFKDIAAKLRERYLR